MISRAIQISRSSQHANSFVDAVPVDQSGNISVHSSIVYLRRARPASSFTNSSRQMVENRAVTNSLAVLTKCIC